MNDISIGKFTRFTLAAGTALATLASTAAMAGDTVLYQAIPGWVEEAQLDTGEIEDGPAALIYDAQHRLEDGVVISYEDSAMRIDNPQSLMENGTISLDWYPDKGDLSIHRVQILRGDQVIDVIANGTEFDILRREQGLEMRLLDGKLTATLPVPGLQVGDVLRVTHSVTLDDQALGDEMQAFQYLATEPWQVGFARTIVSWPADEEVYWRAEDHAAVAEPISVGGDRRLTVSLPLAEMPDMPADAPSRFKRHPMLRVGTFADWQELSRVMEPHYAEAASVANDSEVAKQARAIMQRSNDPLERTAFAVRLVQDEISYLLNGLDGGNYLPQDAAETWEKRYGDCKAKSVLLHALLREMGISSQVVLVTTQGGDAIPELLPIPGNFDHMIVRATIDGTDYWLDGTSAATRIGNMTAVPPFHYALPLTPEGSNLVAMEQRDPAVPTMEMIVTSDYSAGIDLPALTRLEMRISGAQGAQLRKVVDEADENTLRQWAKGMGGSMDGGTVTDIELDYDDEDAIGTITVKAVSGSEFSWQNGRLAVSLDQEEKSGFSADRAKAEWRDIPVATVGPMWMRVHAELLLPAGLTGFEIDGPTSLDDGFANTAITASNMLKGGRFIGEMDYVQRLGEIAPEDLNAAKRAARRLASQDTKLIAPEDVSWRWEVDEKLLSKRIAPLLEAYSKAIDFAEEDDYGPLRERAGFFQNVYRFEDALADLDRLVMEDTSANTLMWRAQIYRSLGRDEDEIADYRRAYELEPENDTAIYMAERLAYAGRTDEAIDLLESLYVSDDDLAYYASTYAMVSGLAGDRAGAEAAIDEALDEKPNDAGLLNGVCWYRGLQDVVIDGTLALCDRAVERTTNSAQVLDSRAMVHYRMGNYEAALADLDSALELVPGQSGSIFLRGIVLQEMGRNGGAEQIAQGLRISPELASAYAAHGIVPK